MTTVLTMLRNPYQKLKKYIKILYLREEVTFLGGQGEMESVSQLWPGWKLQPIKKYLGERKLLFLTI